MIRTYKTLLTGLTAFLTLAASPGLLADPGEVDPNVTRLLQSRLGDVELDTPVKMPAENVYQTRFGSKYAYLIGNGRYVVLGDMIDLKDGVNLTELARRDTAREALAQFPQEDLVVFAAEGETRSVLNVFTDTSCGYCQKLHGEVAELQKAGIEVRYFPFPRGGARGPGYQDLRKVWCSEDRVQSMNVAKGVEPGDLEGANCDDAKIVDAGYQLGNSVGITGTPALFTSSGRKFDGYVPYQQLIPMLLSGS